MVSYKLDKYDRIFVAFVLVIITLFNIVQCFAVENIPEGYNLINANLLLSDCRLEENGYLNNLVGTNLYYYDIENFDNILYFNSKSIKYTFTNTLDYSLGGNTQTTVYTASTNSDGIYIDVSNINQKYLLISYYSDNVVSVYGKDYNGMGNGVKGLVENVGVNQLWGVFEGGIDFVGVVVLVAFGVFLLALAIKKISKGKSEF